MPTDPHRVTAQHVRGLAASDRMRGNQTFLADTDDGLCYVSASAALAPGSKVHRLLMPREDLVESADVAGQTLAAYVSDNAARLAAELNAVLAEKGDA